jgi:hypothetical protein
MEKPRLLHRGLVVTAMGMGGGGKAVTLVNERAGSAKGSKLQTFFCGMPAYPVGSSGRAVVTRLGMASDRLKKA